MAEKYTYADVIIDPEDPRVEIGKEYYFSNTASCCLEYARRDEYHYIAKLREAVEGLHLPFKIGDSLWACLIRKKEPEYVPFDLSDPEVRKSLRGRWIKDTSDFEKEGMIVGFSLSIFPKKTWSVCMSGESGETIPADYLLENCVFDDGTPCGKQIESK